MLSFDDQHVDNWHSYRDLFDKYNARLIFYVTRPEDLNKNEIQKLKDLSNDGHIIGSHGMKHRHINEFESAGDYYNDEVLPAIEFFNEHGIEINTYAYPFGKGSYATDSLLNSKGITTRHSDWNWEHKIISKTGRFYVQEPDKKNNLIALGIDENYRVGRLDIIYGLKKVQKEGSTLVLHAHKISKSPGKYKLNPGKLEFLLKQCEKRGVDFYLP